MSKKCGCYELHLCEKCRQRIEKQKIKHNKDLYITFMNKFNLLVEEHSLSRMICMSVRNSDGYQLEIPQLDNFLFDIYNVISSVNLVVFNRSHRSIEGIDYFRGVFKNSKDKEIEIVFTKKMFVSSEEY